MKNSSSFRHILILELNGLKKTIFLDKNNYSVGRNPTNSIVIHHRIISRHHASLLKITYKKVEEDDAIFWIIDGDLKGNRSTNGIYINEKRSLSHKLAPGDIILLGGVEVKAKYDIVDKHTQKFFSLLTENGKVTNNNKEEERVDQEPLKDDYKSTFVGWNENTKEPLTEQFLLKVNSLQNLLTLPIIEVDLEGEIKHINLAAEKQFPDLKELKFDHPILQKIKQIFPGNESNLLVREINIDGDKFTQYISAENKLIVSYIFDYKKRQQLQLAIKEDGERYHNLVKQISEGIFLLDPISKQIIYANPAYCDLLGYSLEEILELNIYDLEGIDSDILQKDLQKITQEKIAFIRESIHKRKNNTFVSVEVGVSFIFYQAKEVLCFIVRDITEKERVQEILRYQSFHNSLTTLPNQKLFYQQLKTSLYNIKNTDKILALIFIKLKNLKKINYTLGYNIGDQLIQNLAKKIKTCINSIDILAHLQEDKFAVLLPEIDNRENVVNFIKNLLESLKEPFLVDDYQLKINIKMGISLSPSDAKDTTTLLRKADAALENSQQKVGNTYQFFIPAMIDEATKNLKLENLLNLAIETEKLELLYQPIINVKTGEIIEFEAKIKWHDSDDCEISSEQFLPIAKDSGLIIPLNYWLIKNACQQNQIWQRNNLPAIKIKTKLYSLCVQDENFLSQLTDILAETQLDPRYLNLAIQPDNIHQNWQSSRTKLMSLLDMGINISFDDFGLGNSGLNYLRQFPFHKLQLTSSLIQNLAQEPENLAIISAILTLPLSFDMQIVASGINSFEQMELLVNLQCEEMQGELISKFLNVETATDLLSGKQEDLTEIIDQKTIFKISNINKNNVV